MSRTPPTPAPVGGNEHVGGGRYRLDGLVGRGGMADVSRAHRRRPRPEGRRLSRTSLVTILDAGIDRPFMVLELVTGPSRADVLVAADRPSRHRSV